jgi:hypothetical protein
MVMMKSSFNSDDGMWKVEAESSAKTISLEDLLAGPGSVSV